MYQISFEIDSSLDQVSLAGVSISALCRHIGIDDMLCFQLETAAVEAINNAIIHAYKNEQGHSVKIKWLYDEKSITLTIMDNGITMKNPIPDKLVEQDSEHGRGWYIIREWTDELCYSTKNGINTVLLKKYI